MPKKINVVSLSDIKTAEEDTLESNNDERNQITEAIKEEESLNPPVVEDIREVQPMEEVKTKPKRKPASKKTKVIEEESVVVEPVVQPVVETVVEVKEEAPQKKVKTLELVKCEKCNKEMTKRTLRYDHDKTCKGAPIKREDIPVQKRAKKTNSPKQQQTPPKTIIPEHIIEQEIKKRIQSSLQDRVQQRMKLKEERIKKLSANIA